MKRFFLFWFWSMKIHTEYFIWKRNKWLRAIWIYFDPWHLTKERGGFNLEFSEENVLLLLRTIFSNFSEAKPALAEHHEWISYFSLLSLAHAISKLLFSFRRIANTENTRENASAHKILIIDLMCVQT